MDDAGSTWAGTHHFTAPRVVNARSVADVQAALEGDGPVRALGTRHSFTDIADSTGTLVTVTDIEPEPELDEAAQSVTVSAGTRYGVLATWLHEHGWALHNMGSLPHISIGGAIATGTHGSGVTNGTLSSAVNRLDYVNASGELVTVRRGDPDFDGLVVGLGAFGITVRVGLDIQPTYLVRQDVYNGMTWESLFAHLDEVLDAAYSVSVFAMWGEDTLDQVWRKTRVTEDAAHGEIDPATASAVPDQWLDGTRRPQTGTILVDSDPSFLTEQGGVVGPWLERLPHFRLDSTPSNGDEIQTEYFVDRSYGEAALQAVRALAGHIDPLLYITELRTIARDDHWLSGAYGRHTLAIHFTWKNMPDAVADVLPHIESALAPFQARPHWGKLHTFDAKAMAAAHPRLDDARALFEELDPDGRFSNDHLERLGVRVRR